MFFKQKPMHVPAAADALPGRAEPVRTADLHFVNGHSIRPPYPKDTKALSFGMGCFWGAERLFWQREGVHVTAVGYQGGHTPNPTYEEVCSGRTGHTEIVRVVFDPARIDPAALFKTFWEEHDPTQGMRQGNDRGTQYRSAIYTDDPSMIARAEKSRAMFEKALRAKGLGQITTEIADGGEFYFAEAYHQQYLAKNPMGYCGLQGTGVSCPIGTGAAVEEGSGAGA